MSGARKVIYRFKSFRLDLAERQLLQNDEAVPLTPKAFDVLVYLVEHVGHLVEKDELMQSVWPDSFVEETNVTRIVHTLRKALREDENGNKFIETVPKRGYRFVAEVQPLEAAEHALGKPPPPITEITYLSTVSPSSQTRHPLDNFPAPQNTRTSVVAHEDLQCDADQNKPETPIGPFRKANLPQTKRHLRVRPAYLGLVAAGLILGTVGLSYYIFVSGNMTIRRDGRTTIAVLPLKPIDTANRDEIYDIGIADFLIHKLSSTKDLVIRPLSATRKYADVSQDAMTAGKEQLVDYVLASNYQLAGGKIRIDWQLIRMADGQVLETYISEKDTANAFAMEDAIANEIGNILSARFAASAGTTKARRETDSEEAYRKYLQGMYLYDKRTLADARKAVDLLEQAVTLDPTYSRAWAGKAHAHRSLGNFGGNTHEEYSKSIEAINHALALDPNIADAHSALCENKYFYEWDFDGAEQECRLAISLDPNSSIAHDVYARFLYGRARFNEAIAEMKIAIDLEPTSLFCQRNYGISLYYARQYREAIAQFKRVTEMDPNFVATYAWLVPALNVQGSKDEAFEWFLKWQTALKTDEDIVQAYKKEYRASGWQGVGHERVKRFDEGKIRSYFLEACLTVHSGDADKAFEYLEKSYQRREWGMSYLHVDPSLDAIRGDSRFEDLVRRAEAK